MPLALASVSFQCSVLQLPGGCPKDAAEALACMKSSSGLWPKSKVVLEANLRPLLAAHSLAVLSAGAAGGGAE